MTTPQTIFTNARLFIGDGREVIPDGAVWVDGEEIRWSGPRGDLRGVSDGARRIDCGGRFLMPGLVESHAHLFYGGASKPGDNDLNSPAEEAFLTAIENAALMLRMGFTSACGFASLHRTDVAQGAAAGGRRAGHRLRDGPLRERRAVRVRPRAVRQARLRGRDRNHEEDRAPVA